MEAFTIYHSTHHIFSLSDRIRILFGKQVKVYSEIQVDKEVKVGMTLAKTRVDKFIKRTPKHMEQYITSKR